MPADRPNIVFILTDQQRYDTLGATGQAVARTPHLDALARGGVVFEQHHVANPVCSPSRGAIFTGRYPTDNGLWCNGARLPRAARTIPAALGGEAGYATAHFGKLHLEPIIVRTAAAHPYGFQTCAIGEGDQHLLHDDYSHWLRRRDPSAFVNYWNQHFAGGHDRAWTANLPEELTLTHWVADRAVDWLGRHGQDGPFFLSLGFFAPHHPFNPPEPYASALADAPVDEPLFDETEFAAKPPAYGDFFASVRGSTRDAANIRAVRRAYHALMAQVDAAVGRVLGALERLGLRDDTVVVFSSDHGEFLGEHGLLWKGPYLLDDLMRVPLVVSWPARLRGGQRVAELTSAVDFFDTFAALAGVPGSGEADARPILGPGGLLPRGPRECVRYEWEHPNTDRVNHSLRGLRTRTHKLVRYAAAPAEMGELYDLAADPRELRNRWADPACAGIRAGLEERLAERPLSGRPPVPYEGGW